MKSVNKIIDKYVIANLKLYGNCVIKRELYERIDDVLKYLKKEFGLDCELRVEVDNVAIRSETSNKLVKMISNETYILEVKR